MLSTGKRFVKKILIRAVHAHNERERKRLKQTNGIEPAAWGATIGDSGNLVIGGVDVADLARDYGTPLHVVNHSRLACGLRALREQFQEPVSKNGHRIFIQDKSFARSDQGAA